MPAIANNIGFFHMPDFGKLPDQSGSKIVDPLAIQGDLARCVPIDKAIRTLQGCVYSLLEQKIAFGLKRSASIPKTLGLEVHSIAHEMPDPPLFVFFLGSMIFRVVSDIVRTYMRP